MDIQSVLTAYRRQAPFYDAVFGVLLGPGRRQTVRLANRLAGRQILEVGVGTGLSLPAYRPEKHITGIDLSPDMLRIAEDRVTDQGLDNVDGLLLMDAEQLSFPDNSFDTVIGMYIASVVPNPARMVAEMQRVCRPDGDILIVNHFAETGGIRGTVEKWLGPLSNKLGWRPDFKIESVLKPGSLEVQARHQTAPFGLFTILQCRNGKAGAKAARNLSQAAD